MGKIFVTGTTGQVGVALVRELVKVGENVVALVREGSFHPFLEELPIEKVIGDLKDPVSIEEGMKGCNRVYHVAGLISYNRCDEQELYRVNVEGVKNVLNAALKNKVERVVQTSSTAAVGIELNPNHPLNENATLSTKLKSIGYVHTKFLGEQEVQNAIQKGLDVVMVNPSTIFGEGDEKMNTGALFKNIKENKLIAAPPGGTGVVGLKDVVQGHLLAMEKGKTGERYILSGENLILSELFNKIARIVGSKQIRYEIPRFLFYPLKTIAWFAETINKKAKLTPQVIFFSFHFRYFSSQKAQTSLNWKPEKKIDSSLQEAFNYYMKRNLL